MRTELCDVFDIDVPIFAFSHCRDVVAAVTNAGGMGVLGALAFSPEQLEIELKWIDAFRKRIREIERDTLRPLEPGETEEAARPRLAASAALRVRGPRTSSTFATDFVNNPG